MEQWLSELEQGRPEVAWDLFLGRYRRLIFATVRRHARDQDEVMDLFTSACGKLRDRDMARLRRYGGSGAGRAKFSTWLVAVVRNLAIDRLRELGGRRRPPAIAERLPPLQREILEHVIVHGRSHREAFELIRSGGADLSFGAFLKELAAVYRAVQGARGGRSPKDVAWIETTSSQPERAEESQRREILAQVLSALSPDDRAAVRLYVVEEVPAGEVARILGLPNAKAVYNRVYRALAAVRVRLEKAGYRHAGDV